MKDKNEDEDVKVVKRDDGYYYQITMDNAFKAEHGPYVGEMTARQAAEWLKLVLEKTDYFG